MNFIMQFEKLDSEFNEVLNQNQNKIIPNTTNLYINLKLIECYTCSDGKPLKQICCLKRLDDFSAEIVPFVREKLTVQTIKNAVYASAEYKMNSLNLTERGEQIIVSVPMLTQERIEKIKIQLNKIKNEQIEVLRNIRQNFKKNFISKQIKDKQKNDEKRLEDMFTGFKLKLETMYENARKKIIR